MKEFVGRERELNILKEAYYEMKNGNPQLVTFIGDTGLGKTRIIQEFYEFLAKTENEGDYWPKKLMDKEKSMTIIPDLNEINIKGYEQVSWMWYAMRCEERDKRNSVNNSTALDGMREQIGVHVYTIYKKKEKNKKNIAAIKSVIGLIASFGLPGNGIPFIKHLTEVFQSVDTSLSTKENVINLYERVKKRIPDKESNEILSV